MLEAVERMVSFDDYDILKILGRDLSSVCYKVREKKSCELKVFRVISYAEINDSKEKLLARVSDRITYTGDNFLKFDDCIFDSESGSLYLVTEYCKYGSLHNIIKKCITKGIHLKEDFIWYVLCCLIHNIKYSSTLTAVDINIKKIFVNSSFNIKLFCFDEKKFQDESAMRNSIVTVLLQLSSLNLKPQMDKLYILSVYSDSLRDMITYLLDTDLKDSLDIILWHPMVFPRKNQKFNSGIFNKLCIHQTEIEDTDFQSKLKNLKNREVALQIRESKLIAIEHDLMKRENKIALLEKAMKEKLLQADLRLKRINNKKHNEKGKIQREKLDNSSSVDYCDSVIIPTNSKLNHDYISKSKLSRSVSERRIKFKGHSPLKAVRNLQISHPKPKIESENHKNKAEFEKATIRTLCNKPESNRDKIRQTSKKRFSFVNILTRKSTNKTIETKHSNSQKDLVNEEFNPDSFKPIVWTEENKRQAFNLLRIMNSESSSVDEDCVINIKHTKM